MLLIEDNRLINDTACVIRLLAVVGYFFLAVPAAEADETESTKFIGDMASLKDDSYDGWFESNLPYFLYDRGTGVTTSLFGAYVRKGELLLYPFYEYEREEHFDYNPADFGINNDADFVGVGNLNEFLLFAAYGLTKNLAVELEFSVYEEQSINRSKADVAPGPRTLSESGIGAFQTELRWRMIQENEWRPEFYSNIEVVFPLQPNRMLIGQQEWELVYGIGMVKGFSWGTLTARASITHEPDIDHTQFGEYAVEYLKRFGDNLRWVMTLEGNDKELASIFELQWFFNKDAFLKLNTGIGLTQETPDFAPEIGVMFRF